MGIPWESIGRDIGEATSRSGLVKSLRNIGGGDINQAAAIEFAGTEYFVKLNDAGRLPMFEAEALGLEEILACNTLSAPAPVCCGCAGSHAWLVLEFIELTQTGNSAALGRGLAGMHRLTRPRFGWVRDNTIGSTPQINTPGDSWIGFWREHRLRFQFETAAGNGYGGRLQSQGQKLMATFHHLFSAYAPAASLLHGDLWAGNYAFTGNGEPVIFDPAVYFGDRETDLAMTELFGGFNTDFYAAYRDHYPLDPGYPVRKTLYQLYHVLNHLNLFGSGYRSRAEHMTDALLAELG